MIAINGIDVPIDVGAGVKSGTEQLGEAKRAVDGTMKIQRRVLKWQGDFRTTIIDSRRAEAFRRLLLGEGNNWSFDDPTKGLYSGKGLGPSASTGASLSTANPYLGPGHLRLAAATGTISFRALPGAAGLAGGMADEWTVMCARDSAGAGTWPHYIVTNESKAAGFAWVDGVYQSIATPWLTVFTPTGTVTLISSAGALADYAELVILPFRIPHDSEIAKVSDRWGSQIFDYISGYGHQWAPLARVRVYGSAVGPYGPVDIPFGAGLVCSCKMKEAGFVVANVNSIYGYDPGNRHLAFMLEEV